MIFGRHAERTVTDEMSSFHSERLTPDNGQGRTARCGGIAKFCTVQRSRSFALRHLFVSNKTSARYGSDQVTVLADQLQAGFMLRYNKRTVGYREVTVALVRLV